MRRLQPRKNMPNTTVRDKTHMTAIWTTLMMKRLLSSDAAATKPLSVTTEERLQHRNSSVLLSSPPSVWLNPVLFISGVFFLKSNFSTQETAEWEKRAWRNPAETVIKGRGGGAEVPSRQTQPFWSSESCFGFTSCVLQPVSERNESTSPRLNSQTPPARVKQLQRQDNTSRAPPHDRTTTPPGCGVQLCVRELLENIC